MDRTQLRASLEQGGFDEDSTAGSIPAYWPLLDPSGADRLGAAISVTVARFKPDWLVTPSKCDDVLLCFIVARDLSLPVARIVESEGLIGFDREPPIGSRLAYVSRFSPDSNFLRAMVAAAERARSELVGVSVLLADAASQPTGVPSDALYRYESHPTPPRRARKTHGR